MVPQIPLLQQKHPQLVRRRTHPPDHRNLRNGRSTLLSGFRMDSFRNGEAASVAHLIPYFATSNPGNKPSGTTWSNRLVTFPCRLAHKDRAVPSHVVQ